MKYKYISNWSGELQPNILNVIKETFNYIINYSFEWKMLSWKFNEKGW